MEYEYQEMLQRMMRGDCEALSRSVCTSDVLSVEPYNPTEVKTGI